MELLYLLVGFGFGYLIFKPRKEGKEKAPFLFEKKEEELDAMTLRNGYGVSGYEKPTFAEQILNIANFSGENQKEEKDE